MFLMFRQTTTTLDDGQDGNTCFQETAASFTLLDLAGEIAPTLACGTRPQGAWYEDIQQQTPAASGAPVCQHTGMDSM